MFDHPHANTPPGNPPQDPDHARLLSVLARADSAALIALAETLLPHLSGVQVLHSRTGLVMLPMRDTVRGTDFHLGEVLVAQAHLRATRSGTPTEGYGMVVGRDLQHAMAMAVVDAVAAVAPPHPGIAAFVDAQAQDQARADADTLRAVESTRVQMETF